MLDDYLPAFLEFFFPEIHAEIDWQRRYEPLDKELAKIQPDDFMGKLLADKLFKVWLLGGTEIWLLIHIEVQVQSSRKFNRRVFVYNYRLMNAHGVEVVSLVVLTGARPGKTGQYEIRRWGCSHEFKFPAVRLTDYRARWEELDASRNPFAVVVKAHLKALETKGDHERRYEWKRRLIFELYRRSYQRQEIINLFRFLNWVVTLPEDFEEQLQQEIYQYERRNKMPYISTFERKAEARGLQQGLEQGLEQGLHKGVLDNVLLIWAKKFGAVAEVVRARLTQLTVEQLQALTLTILEEKAESEVLATLAIPTAKKRSSRKQSK